MNEYLLWLANETDSIWWNDSAVFTELEFALQHGAQGVTTNPVLIADAIYKDPYWKPYLDDISTGLKKPEKTEAICKVVTSRIAQMFLPIFERTEGLQGYVCAQVDPRRPGDRDQMKAMAERLNSWAPNIAVKLPVTSAGLDVLEDCIAQGITITATVSFTMAQVVAVGERCQIGVSRAKKAGIKPGRCFAVVMVGRIDDYLRDVVHDSDLNIADNDIIQSGTAIIKRAYDHFNKNNFDAVLMPAGMRGGYHAESLSNAKMSMSINPKIQVMLPSIPKPYIPHINDEIDNGVIKRLMQIPEFVRAYEPDELKAEEFITFGVVQKTLAQFVENWKIIENYTAVENISTF